MLNIELHLYATLSKYLPEGATAKSVQVAAEENIRVKDLLERFGVPEKSVKLIFVNGVHARFDRLLAEGDRVGIFPAVGGG